MKKIFLLWVVFLSIVISKSVDAISISPDAIIPPTWRRMLNTSEGGTWLLDYVFASLRDLIFWVLAFIATAMFLYIWARLVIARWNPEEFSKALKSFIYAAIGIFVIVFAWAAVRLVSWITL